MVEMLRNAEDVVAEYLEDAVERNKSAKSDETKVDILMSRLQQTAII